MAEINGYGAVAGRYTSQTDDTKSTDDKKVKVQQGNQGLQMQDFLNLLVAQITNQDAMNPMDNTEFISQMAQFSSLQAMSDLTKISIESQATSLIGKNVVVATYDDYGRLVQDEGIVQRVAIYGNETRLYVNDKEYYYANVMEVKAVEAKEPPEPEKEPPKTDGDGPAGNGDSEEDQG